MSDHDDARTGRAGETGTGRRPLSPFEDPVVLAEITAILQRGYDRYLAAQRSPRLDTGQERDREQNRDDDRERDRDTGQDVDGHQAA